MYSQIYTFCTINFQNHVRSVLAWWSLVTKKRAKRFWGRSWQPLDCVPSTPQRCPLKPVEIGLNRNRTNERQKFALSERLPIPWSNAIFVPHLPLFHFSVLTSATFKAVRNALASHNALRVFEVKLLLLGTRSKTTPEDVLSLSYIWSSHKRERQNTFRVVFSNAAQRRDPIANRIHQMLTYILKTYRAFKKQRCFATRIQGCWRYSAYVSSFSLSLF